jgi:hypothetical protein
LIHFYKRVTGCNRMAGKEDSNSTATSLEDKTEDFAGNPTRDALADGLMCMIKPTVDVLDKNVAATLQAQAELKSQISLLQADLRSLSSNQSCPLNLENYISKLGNSKKRVTVVANILATAQDRLNRVHQACLRETAKRRALLEPSPATTPSGPEAPARLPQ